MVGKPSNQQQVADNKINQSPIQQVATDNKNIQSPIRSNLVCIII